MSSPKIVVFYLYNETSGVVLTGATPTFDTYKDDLGANIAQPAITEVGGGAYKFTPDITTTPDRGIVFVVNGGAGSSPRRQSGYVRPEDFAADLLPDMHAMEFGKWEIKTSGLDINRLLTYKLDGVTILKKFNLFDAAGAPTSINPFKRDPI